jgi:hypothetical protein
LPPTAGSMPRGAFRARGVSRYDSGGTRPGAAALRENHCDERPRLRARGERPVRAHLRAPGPLHQRRPRPHHPRGPQVGHERHRRAVDLHGRVCAHLHPGLVAHRAGHELVAGGAHDLSGQLHRADPDGAQRPRGHEVRHPLSGVLPRGLRRARGQRARGAARPRGLRVVRDPSVDRRLGDLPGPRGLRAVHHPPLAHGPSWASTPRSSRASSCSGG